MEPYSLYFVGGLGFLIAVWKGLYWLWKHSDIPVVKERSRNAMRDIASEIQEAKDK